MSSVIKIGQSDYSEENIIDNWAGEYAKRELENHKNNPALDHPDGCVTLDKLGDDVKDKMDNVSETIDSLLVSCNTADAQIRVIKNNISGIEENLNNFIDIADRIEEETNTAKTDSISAMVAAKKANLAASDAALKSENSNSLSQEAKEIAENAVEIAEQAVLKSENSNSLAQEAKEIAENAVGIAEQAVLRAESADYLSFQADSKAFSAMQSSEEALDTASRSNELANEAKEIAQSVRADANNGVFNGKDGVDGENGEPGKDGYTPQKGVDYWTEADKEEIKADVVGELTRSSTALPEMLAVNTIYDLGEQDALTLNLPSGKLGDFIEVDFLSTQTPTTLTITASSGMSDYDLIPDANTIYSLYFNWIRLDAENYGWGFGYAEYTRTVTE